MCFCCSTHFKQIYVPKHSRLIPRLMWSCDVLTFPTLSLRNTCSVGRHRWRRLFFLVFMLLGRSRTQQGRWNGWSHFKRPCIWSIPRIRKDENTRSISNSREMEVNTTRNRMVQRMYNYLAQIFMFGIHLFDFWECEDLQYRYWYCLMFFTSVLHWFVGPMVLWSQAYSADIAAFYQEAAVNAGADYFQRLCLVHQKIHIQG